MRITKVVNIIRGIFKGKKGDITTLEDALEQITCCPTLSCCHNALVLTDEVTKKRSYIRVESGALVVYDEDNVPPSMLSN